MADIIALSIPKTYTWIRVLMRMRRAGVSDALYAYAVELGAVLHHIIAIDAAIDNSIAYDDVPYNDVSYDDAPYDDVPYDDVPHDDAPYDDAPHDAGVDEDPLGEESLADIGDADIYDHVVTSDSASDSDDYL
jgi:hypothetical protein